MANLQNFVCLAGATAAEPDICEVGGSGLLLPLFGDDENGWSKGLRQVLYIVGLLWCFMGVAIVADVFMGAIEKVTSSKRTITDPVTKRTTTVKVWNDTVANLTLMALGSSAPEILLSVIELFQEEFHSGSLGPSTIVGSAAFNLLVITAVCVVAIPEGEIRKIKDMGVFAITAFFSVFAYVWLLFILVWVSPDVVESWEGIVTFLFFPLLVVMAYAADTGMFCSRTAQRERIISAADLSKDELAEMVARIRKTNGGNDLSEEELARLLARETQSRSRAAYRNRAVRAGTGGQRQSLFIKDAPSSLQISPEGEERVHKANELEVGFLSGASFAVLENGGAVRLPVQRTSTTGRLTVDFATRDGTAKQVTDYVATSGTLTFEEGEQEKIIEVKIVDDEAFEEDEDFYVDLSNVVAPVGWSAVLPEKEKTATVTIIDDDLPGVLSFVEDTTVAAEMPEDKTYRFAVQRRQGSTGTVSCKYATEEDSATAGADFEHAEGTLEFGPGEVDKTIEVVVKARGRYESAEKFRLILTECEGGCKFDGNTDGGEESCILTVEIAPNKELQDKVDFTSKILRMNADKIALGNANYREQFRAALYVNGSAEDQAEATRADWVMHILTVFWKVLFAFIPPTDYAGGWICFFSSLIMIGVVTAIIGDLASMVGCVLGIPPSVTAITFVALGTSLPDLFASKQAAEQDPYADASIGNVTGSNSVNVFLGLGLPWMIGALYWDSEGLTLDWLQTICGKKPEILTDGTFSAGEAGFVVVAGSLGYSVTVFCACACSCIAGLVLRRKLYGGELGGPNGPKYAAAAFFVSLWILYIVLSSIKAMDEEK